MGGYSSSARVFKERKRLTVVNGKVNIFPRAINVRIREEGKERKKAINRKRRMNERKKERKKEINRCKR